MRTIRKAAMVVLAVLLLVNMWTVTAKADEYTFQGTEDETAYFVMFSDETDFIEEARIYDGEIPGMWLEVSGDVTLGLAGTPTKAGTFTVLISATTAKRGQLGIVATVTVEPKPSSGGTPTITKNPTGEKVVEGETTTFIARADNTQQYVWIIAIADAEIDCADLPSYIGGGIKVSGANSEKLVLSNIPKSLDGSFIWCRFVGAEESVDSEAAKLTVISAKDAKPVVTKNPDDAVVEEGEGASFKADAQYARKYEWQLESPDGVTYTTQQAQDHFPPLRISGGDSGTVELQNIPVTLDGYRILCKFTAGETVYGKAALITVTPKSTEEPTERPTEKPTEAPTEPPTEMVTEENAASETKAAIVYKDINQKPEDNNGRVIALIICTTVLLLAVIAAVVIIVLIKHKKRAE